LGALCCISFVVMSDSAVEKQLALRWLDERRGVGKGKLTDEASEVLAELHGGGHWSFDDAVTVTNQTEVESHQAVFFALSELIDETLAAGSSKARTKMARARDLAWMMTVTSVTRDGSMVLKVPEARTPEKAKARTKEADEEPEELSEVQSADMEVQGAVSVAQLARLSVSIHVGRKASREFCRGAGYGEPHTQAEGVRKASKVRSFGSQKPIGEVLETAMRTGDLDPVDLAVTKTTEQFLGDPNDQFYVQAASRLLQLWAKSKSIEGAESCPQIAAYYFFMILDHTAGRGLPIVTDHEIMRQARRAALKSGVCDTGACAPAPAPAPKGAPATRQGAQDSSTDRVLTAIGLMSDEVKVIRADQMEIVTRQADMVVELAKVRSVATESAAAIGKVKNGLSDQRDAMASLRRKLPQDESREQAGFEREHRFCYNCHKKGHLSADCPEPARSGPAKAADKED
jgi:hypothetical protein